MLANGGARRKPVAYIVVHYTACPNASARAVIKAWERSRSASSHYVVDLDGEVVEAMKPEYIAYHVGDGEVRAGYARANTAAQWHLDHPTFSGNSNSVGVDVCCTKDSTKSRRVEDSDWRVPDLCRLSLVGLLAQLCVRFQLDPRKNILRHADATGKPCPRPWVSLPTDRDGRDRDGEWYKIIGAVVEKWERMTKG